MEGPFSTVGQRVAPVYGIDKVTGVAKFAPDIVLPDMLWMKILRSPHAHALLLDIDTSEAFFSAPSRMSCIHWNKRLSLLRIPWRR